MSPCRNLDYRLFAFTHKIFKNSEKTIKYRFFRGRQSEKRSFSVPYSNYKLYFEDKCLESVLISVFSLFWFRFFSFARNKREKMNVKKHVRYNFSVCTFVGLAFSPTRSCHAEATGVCVRFNISMFSILPARSSAQNAKCVRS